MLRIVAGLAYFATLYSVLPGTDAVDVSVWHTDIGTVNIEVLDTKCPDAPMEYMQVRGTGIFVVTRGDVRVSVFWAKGSAVPRDRRAHLDWKACPCLHARVEFVVGDNVIQIV